MFSHKRVLLSVLVCVESILVRKFLSIIFYICVGCSFLFLHKYFFCLSSSPGELSNFDYTRVSTYACVYLWLGYKYLHNPILKFQRIRSILVLWFYWFLVICLDFFIKKISKIMTHLGYYVPNWLAPIAVHVRVNWSRPEVDGTHVRCRYLLLSYRINVPNGPPYHGRLQWFLLAPPPGIIIEK